MTGSEALMIVVTFAAGIGLVIGLSTLLDELLARHARRRVDVDETARRFLSGRWFR